MDPHACGVCLRVLRIVAATIFALAWWPCAAQTPSHLSDAETQPPSRWTGEAQRLDEQIRLRVLSADDPRSHWIAGQFDTTDIASKVRIYAAARVAAPQVALHIADLALACLQPVQPTLPECDAIDRLADWATRDGDNGLPTMLLAARASRRGDNEGTIAYLELAAAKLRFDEYASRGNVELWDYVMAFPADADRAAKATLAIGYGDVQGEPSLALVPSPCVATPAVAETRRTACGKAGLAMAERGASGAQRAALPSQLARCGDDERSRLAALESADAAIRARTIDGLDRIVRDKERLGQVAECERRLAAK